MAATAPLTTADKKSMYEWASKLSTLPETNKLTVRLHLLSLMFEVSRVVITVTAHPSLRHCRCAAVVMLSTCLVQYWVVVYLLKLWSAISSRSTGRREVFTVTGEPMMNTTQYNYMMFFLMYVASSIYYASCTYVYFIFDNWVLLERRKIRLTWRENDKDVSKKYRCFNTDLPRFSLFLAGDAAAVCGGGRWLGCPWPSRASARLDATLPQRHRSPQTRAHPQVGDAPPASTRSVWESRGRIETQGRSEASRGEHFRLSVFILAVVGNGLEKSCFLPKTCSWMFLNFILNFFCLNPNSIALLLLLFHLSLNHATLYSFPKWHTCLRPTYPIAHLRFTVAQLWQHIELHRKCFLVQWIPFENKTLNTWCYNILIYL